MSHIVDRPVQQNVTYRAGNTLAPAQTTTAGAATQVAPTTTAQLSESSNVPSSPAASSGVTNAQGHAARLALGSEQGTGQIALEQKGQAEGAVAANTARKTPVDFNSLESKEARKDFLKNVTQLDGHDIQGDRDGQSCGPTALVSSITMADPKATQKLAKGILDMSGSEREKSFTNALDKGQQEALRRISDGKASPDDVRILGQVMAGTKGVNVANGASPDEMAKMLSVTTKILGDDMPNFSMHMYSSATKAGEAHWQGYANGTEIDPWPNSQGQATLTDGAAGLGQGASHYENGTVHTKMIVENNGKRIVMPRYLGATGDPNADSATWSRTHNSNVNDPQTTYVYTQDVFGYDYTRQSGNVPANAVGEPSESLGLAL